VSKQKYFQEPLFQELKKDYCYVCYERIKKMRAYISVMTCGATRNANQAVIDG